MIAIVFSVMGLVNFAHGELITIGGYAMYALLIFAGASINLWSVVPIGILGAYKEGRWPDKAYEDARQIAQRWRPTKNFGRVTKPCVVS